MSQQFISLQSETETQNELLFTKSIVCQLETHRAFGRKPADGWWWCCCCRWRQNPVAMSYIYLHAHAPLTLTLYASQCMYAACVFFRRSFLLFQATTTTLFTTTAATANNNIIYDDDYCDAALPFFLLCGLTAAANIHRTQPMFTKFSKHNRSTHQI